MKKQKIVILGAGPAGLAAAYGLSATQALRDQYDVTVYQVGWRAGGKCATGRAGAENRIEQNGTHYLFGCYDNTLSLMRQSYEELDQQGIRDFGDYDQSLLPRDLLALKHQWDGDWALWPLPLPANRAVPGKAEGFLKPWAYFSMFLQTFVTVIFGIRIGRFLRPSSPFDRDRPLWLMAIYAVLRPFLVVISWLIYAVGLILVRLVADILWALGDPNYLSLARLLSGVRRLNGFLLRNLSTRSRIAYRTYTGMDFACTVGIGLIRDLVPKKGISAIEGKEFTQWLAEHGAADETLKAPFVRTWYDAVAAFENGDPDRPNLSAGVSMASICKALMTYKGHFAYQMRAEVGDTFIAPVFECLRQRGVKFRFFHRVWDLVPGEGDLIDRIEIEQQVTLKSGDPDSYDPFKPLLGMKVWPNEPNWDQIDLPADQKPDDLESFYTKWCGQKLPPLRRGVDYDAVVLAMPVMSFPTYCAQLIARNSKWQDMTQHMPGVESQTMRLYFNEPLTGLGWDLPTPILSAYAMPFATWEDNGHLVTVETWPEGQVPKSIATLFGPMKAPEFAPPPDVSDYPDTQTAQMQDNVMAFLETEIGGLWPKATEPGESCAINWAMLVDVQNRKGVGATRLESQYLCANSGPLHRYTMARAGTAQHRLPSHKSQFSNLMLAGDWTSNHYLIGSVEGAIMSGFQASRALCGHPIHIPGEDSGL